MNSCKTMKLRRVCIAVAALTLTLSAGCAGLKGGERTDGSQGATTGTKPPPPAVKVASTLKDALAVFDATQSVDEKSLAQLSPKYRALFLNRKLSGQALADNLRETLNTVNQPLPPFSVQEDAGSADTWLDWVKDYARQTATEKVFGVLRKEILEQPAWQSMTGPNAQIDAQIRSILGTSLNSNSTVTLRGFPGMTDHDARRLLRIAMLRVGAQLSVQTLKEAEKGYADAEKRFAQLLDQREQAARMLADAVTSLQQAGSNRRASGDAALLRRIFQRDDLAQLSRELATLSPSVFAQDMNIQEKALRFLRAKNPASYSEYESGRNLAVSQIKQHAQAALGSAAFIAFSLGVARDTVELLNKSGKKALIAAGPTLFDFGVEVAPAMATVMHTLEIGLIPAIQQRDGGFVVTIDGQTSTLARTDELFSALNKSNALPTLTSGLFANRGGGWMAKLRVCDPANAGKLLDKAAKVEQRQAAVVGYLGEPVRQKVTRYRFETAFVEPMLGEPERRMHDELLSNDHRQTARHPALGELQRQVSQGVTAWSNEDLLRLIYANREATAAGASLYVGANLTIRPRASAEAVYIYQNYEDTCTANVRHRTARS